MKCPNCQTRELVVIEMVVSGEPVALHSCSSCDLRWWETARRLALSGTSAGPGDYPLIARAAFVRT